MSYIALVNAGDYGLTGITQADLDAATALVNAYLKRPEGVVWTPDAAGAPCFMAGMTPMQVLTLSASVSPGLNVTIPAPAWACRADLLGEVFVVDRGVSGKTEALVVNGFTASTIMFERVAYAHDAGALLEAGLVLLEERELPAKRSIMRIPRTPCARLLSGRGRYAYGRRTDQIQGVFQDLNLLSSLHAMGGPPQWIGIDVTQASVSNTTGEVWIPAGIYGAAFTEVRLRYVSGWSQANTPTPILAATASAAAGILGAPEIAGSIKSYQAGGTKIEKFADTLLDASTRATLEPFVALRFY